MNEYVLAVILGAAVATSVGRALEGFIPLPKARLFLVEWAPLPYTAETTAGFVQLTCQHLFQAVLWLGTFLLLLMVMGGFNSGGFLHTIVLSAEFFFHVIVRFVLTRRAYAQEVKRIELKAARSSQ